MSLDPNKLEDLANWCLDVTTAAWAALDEDAGVLPLPTARRVHFGRGDGGEIVWDHCCNPIGDAVGGQLVAAVGTVQPTKNFPAPDNEVVRFSKAWRVPVAVEIVRCMPAADAKGRRDFTKLDADAEVRMREGWVLLCAFRDALSSPRSHQAVVTGLYSPENVNKDTGVACKAVRLNLIFQLGINRPDA